MVFFFSSVRAAVRCARNGEKAAPVALLLAVAAFTLSIGALCAAATAQTRAATSNGAVLQKPVLFAYAFTPKGVIYGYRMGDENSGALIRLPDVNIATGIERFQVATHPSGAFLYVAERYDNYYDYHGIGRPENEPARATTRVLVYRVGANGALSLTQTVTINAIVGQILPHPQGKRVYLVCAGGDVRIYRAMGDTGGLIAAGKTKIPSGFAIPTDSGDNPEGLVTFTPNGNYAFVSGAQNLVITYTDDPDHPLAEAHHDDINEHSAYLQRFRVLANGAWKADGSVWESSNGFVTVRGKQVSEDDRAASPRHPGPVTLTSNGKTALVYGMTNRLWAYRVGSTGALSLYPQRTVPASVLRRDKTETTSGPIAALDPKGRYVVVHDANNERKFFAYRVPPTTNTVAARKPLRSFGKEYQSFYTEPTGRFLYALTPDPAKPWVRNAILESEAPNALAVWKVRTGPQFTATVAPRVFPERINELVFVASPPGSR